MTHKHSMHPLHPLHPAHDSSDPTQHHDGNNSTTNNYGIPPIAITRTRSGQRMWSDPIPKTQRSELAHLRPFITPPTPATPSMHHHYNDVASNRTAIASVAPIAAAVIRDNNDVPLRPLPSTLMAHYRNGSTNYSRYNDNIINSIHDLDLYEDDHHAFDAYAAQPAPRVMRQAPKLLTLDDYNLISLGYKPVMSRKLSWISLTGIAMTAANVFCGVIPLYGLSVTNGGPAWATWSYLFIGLMSIIVSLCLSELASAYPTTAGVHHWVYQLGSSRRRAFLSWMVGWFTIVSAVTVTASIAFYFSAVLSQLLLTTHHTAITSATLVMVHLGVLFAWQLFNLVPARSIGYLSTISGLFIAALAVGIISAMLSLAEFEPSMGHIPFTAFLNYSGSSSTIYAALSSTLMASFVFCPQDTVLRMAEESRRPERTMSRLMIGSSVWSLLVGLPLVVVLNYGIIKPIKGLLDEMIPGVKIILETLGNGTGNVFVALVLVAMFSTGVVRLSMATRTVYAFARDGGLPHSAYWNHLQPRRNTPQRVSWLVTIACMGCIFPFFWGNAVAFQWIASLACISANLCFVVPLWMRLTHEGGLHFIPGTFTLGKFSRPLHMISIVWLLVLSLFLMFPSTYPLSKNNFNYSSIVLIVLAIMFGFSWFKARTDFTGGAKDVSRASHRIPSRPLKDIYPRKQQQQQQHEREQEYRTEDMVTEPRPMAPFRQQPSQAVMQKYKNPGSEKTRLGHGHGHGYVHNFGTNPTSVSRFMGQPRILASLTPPRRDPATTGASKKQLTRQQLQQKLQPTVTLTASMTPSSDAASRMAQRGQASILTMTSIGSNQSHPSSILGLPFSESPEMMPRELAVKNPSPVSSSSAKFSIPQGNDSDGSPAVTSAKPDPGLLLTKPYESKEEEQKESMREKEDSNTALPEISIAPPTTSSTVDESASRSGGRGGDAKNAAAVTDGNVRPLNVGGKTTGSAAAVAMAAVRATAAAAIASVTPNTSKGKTMVSPPKITFEQDPSRDNSSSSVSSSQAAAAAALKRKQPLSAIDSIFKLGFGLSNTLTEKKSGNSNSSHQDGMLGKVRSSKDRAPTPYPSSLVDPEEGTHSDYTGSMMMDDPHPFPAGSLTLSTLHKAVSEKRPHEDRRRSDYSIEEIVGGLDVASPLQHPQQRHQQQSISQYPTLDGYPLIKSPSTAYVGEAGLDGGGDGLHLPTMLPLSRTPTIQLNDLHEYGASFKSGDSDEDDYDAEEGLDDINHPQDDENDYEEEEESRLALHGMIAEADDAYEEEYNHNYPVISISKSKVESLIPATATFHSQSPSSPGVFFRMPNRDISAAPGTTFPIAIPSPSGGCSGEVTPTPLNPRPIDASAVVVPLSRPLPDVPLRGQQEGRHDPIERLLLLAQQQQQRDQGHISTGSDINNASGAVSTTILTTDPVQQHLQRTRSVAHWAQEQAWIQEKRIKHRARVQALKELRKQDPTASLTLSIHSSDSDLDFSEDASVSSFAWSFPKSSSPSQSRSQSASQSQSSSGEAGSGKRVERLKKQHQLCSSGNVGLGGSGRILQSLKEDEPLELNKSMSRLELVVRAQEEAEEEEASGLYMDTDDFMSPSIDIESLGAGVGRPSFRT